MTLVVTDDGEGLGYLHHGSSLLLHDVGQTKHGNHAPVHSHDHAGQLLLLAPLDRSSALWKHARTGG